MNPTRDVLKRIATHVLARRRYAATGRFGLRATPGGFGTPAFGDTVEVKYVYNILDLGYRGEDILWLVEQGVLTLGYQSSSYLTDRIPELGVLDLPFLFDQTEKARAAIDGALGERLIAKVEEKVNYRILGFFENGFRHLSNRLRPVRTPADRYYAAELRRL